MSVGHAASARRGVSSPAAATDQAGQGDDTVLFTLDAQVCGLPVASVRDILDRFELSCVPLAPAEVAGHLNLRGRVVTAIDLRRRLFPAASFSAPDRTKNCHAIVVEHGATLYALLVDQVSEVACLPRASQRPKPIGLSPNWARFASSVCKLDRGLLALLDLERLLALEDDGTTG